MSSRGTSSGKICTTRVILPLLIYIHSREEEEEEEGEK